MTTTVTIGKRTYTVVVRTVDERIDLAEVVGMALSSGSTFNEYAQDVVCRAEALRKQEAKDA